MKKIVAVDLFCGIGGLTYGIKKAGIEVRAGIDIDETCRYAYEVNNCSIFINKSVTEITKKEINSLFGEKNIKLLMGCAPCQPFSNYRKDKKNSNKHKDWDLLNEFLRIIKISNPEIISMENVPALQKENIFVKFYTSLKDMGYYVNYDVHNAENYGVPQRRKRLLLLASKFGEINFLKKDIKKVTVREAIKNLSPIKAGEISKKDFIHRASKLSNLNLQRIRNSIPGKTWELWPENIKPNCYKKKTGLTYKSVFGRMKWDDVAPTLTTQFYNYGTGRYGHPEQDRAISIREGAILQSFPKKYKFVEHKKKFKITEVARHIGNAVPPKLAEYIAQTIINHLYERGVLNE